VIKCSLLAGGKKTTSKHQLNTSDIFNAVVTKEKFVKIERTKLTENISTPRILTWLSLLAAA